MKQLLYLGLLLGLLFSCRKDKTEWNTDLKAPLVSTSLTLSNLVTSDAVKTDGDSTLKLVYETEVANIAATDVFAIEDTTVEFGSSIQSLTLTDDSVSQSISMGQILMGIPFFGPLIAGNNGNLTSIPSFGPLSGNSIAIDNSALVESITIETGQLAIKITNGLPVDITNLTLELRNGAAFGGGLIGTTTFPSIPKGDSRTNYEVLDGKTVYGSLEARLVSFSSPGTGGAQVLLDTTDAIDAVVKFLDVVPLSATAVWHNQDLMDTTRYNKIPPKHGIMLKEMLVKEGMIDFEVYSSLQDTIYITYTVPNLRLNNNSFSVTAKVPPAPVNGITDISESFSFDGYNFKFNGYGIERTIGEDLNGNAVYDPDTINAYLQNFKVRIQYTGQKKTLSKNDTVYIRAKIRDVIPSYAVGYMGKDTVEIGPSSEVLEIFNNYLSGRVQFEDVKMDLSIENGIGADGELEIINLTGTNSKMNTSVALTGSQAAALHPITKGTETFLANPQVNESTTLLNFNSSNSNASDFISNLPNRLDYQLRAVMNPNLPVPSYTEVVNNPPNFVYDGDGLKANMNLEIPLSLVADSLLLQDTLDFSYSGANAGVNNAVFTLAVENGFGYDATLHLVILDENLNEVDTLISRGKINRAIVNSSTGKVTASTKSLIHFNVDRAKINLLQNSSKLKAVIEIHTYDLGDSNRKYHKIRSSDQFKLKLIGQTVYNIQF